MATALFISTVASQVRLGVALAPLSDTADDILVGIVDFSSMEEDNVPAHEEPVLSRAEERQMVRDSTFQFEGLVGSSNVVSFTHLL